MDLTKSAVRLEKFYKAQLILDSANCFRSIKLYGTKPLFSDVDIRYQIWREQGSQGTFATF